MTTWEHWFPLKRLDKTTTPGCWRWVGGHTEKGYGRVYVGMPEGRVKCTIACGPLSAETEMGRECSASAASRSASGVG